MIEQKIFLLERAKHGTFTCVCVSVCVETREKAICVTTNLFITLSVNSALPKWQQTMRIGKRLLHFLNEPMKFVLVILQKKKKMSVQNTHFWEINKLFWFCCSQSITLWIFFYFGIFTVFVLYTHTHVCARTNAWLTDSLKFIWNENVWNIHTEFWQLLIDRLIWSHVVVWRNETEYMLFGKLNDVHWLSAWAIQLLLNIVKNEYLFLYFPAFLPSLISHYTNTNNILIVIQKWLMKKKHIFKSIFQWNWFHLHPKFEEFKINGDTFEKFK